MTPIREFDRRSARVQAMRLDGTAELFAAETWLRAHGVAAWVAVTDYYGGVEIRANGEQMRARLGQWLAHDPGSGEFTVWDDGDGPGQFGREHDNVGVV